MCVRARACSLRYPPWNVHAPYCHLQPARLFNILPMYFRKKLLNIKCVLFSLQLLSETFLALRITARDMIINVKSLHVEYPLFVSDYNETWIFSTYFLKKKLSTKFHVNPSSRGWVVSCGLTERQTLLTKLIVAFRNFTKARKKKLLFGA